MVYATPFAFIPISPKDTICTFGIVRQTGNTMTAYLLHHRAIILLVKISCNQNLWHRRDSLDRINRLTQTFSCSLTKRTTISFTSETTGQVNHKDMYCIT